MTLGLMIDPRIFSDGCRVFAGPAGWDPYDFFGVVFSFAPFLVLVSFLGALGGLKPSGHTVSASDRASCHWVPSTVARLRDLRSLAEEATDRTRSELDYWRLLRTLL